MVLEKDSMEKEKRKTGGLGVALMLVCAVCRCHDNARCESMWARMKTELIYDRCDPEKMTVEELKSLVWYCFLGYWNNRRICSANDSLPPLVKRQRFYDTLPATS